MKENKKILNIILSTLVVTYFISIINAFVAINYEQIIGHFYLVGITAVTLIIPAYTFKYYILNKYILKEKNIKEDIDLPLWKKEIKGIVNPLLDFLNHKLGFFIILILISHIAALLKIDYLFMKFLNNLSLDVFQGMSVWMITIPMFLMIWMFSFYIIFLSKGKYKAIFPTKIFLFPFFLSSIIFVYNMNYIISANLHTEIYAKLYRGVVETNSEIIPCKKEEILCIKISLDDLEKEKNKLLPSINQLEYPEIKKSAEVIINKFIKDVKENKNETTMYYFTSTYSLKYNDEWFSPIIAYNKENNNLLVDSISAGKILKMEKYNKTALVAISSMIWICLILLIDMFHDIFLQWRRVKIKKRENLESNNE